MAADSSLAPFSLEAVVASCGCWYLGGLNVPQSSFSALPWPVEPSSNIKSLCFNFYFSSWLDLDWYSRPDTSRREEGWRIGSMWLAPAARNDYSSWPVYLPEAYGCELTLQVTSRANTVVTKSYQDLTFSLNQAKKLFLSWWHISNVSISKCYKLLNKTLDLT